MFFNLSSVVSKDESRVGGGELWRRGGAAEEEFCLGEDRKGKSSSVTIPRVREVKLFSDIVCSSNKTLQLFFIVFLIF